MKKLFISALTISVVAGSVVLATNAYFSDTEVSTNNTFAAGTLQVDVNDNGSVGVFDMNLGTINAMMPGDSTEEVSLLIKNTGTTNFAWFGYFDTANVSNGMDEAIYIKSAKMEFLNPDGMGTWETMDHFIDNGIGFGTYGAYYTGLANSDPFHVVSMRTFNGSTNNMMGAGYGVFMGALKPNYSYKLTFTLGMAPEAGNEYQASSMDLIYRVRATQINGDAIDTLFAGDTRFTGASSGAAHLPWLNAQIAKQI